MIYEIEQIAEILEKRFSGNDHNMIRAVLSLDAPEGSAIHYIYGYDGFNNETLHYEALYLAEGQVYSSTFSTMIPDNESVYTISLLEDDKTLNKSKQEASWILELVEIRTRINNLLTAIEHGGMVHGNFIDFL